MYPITLEQLQGHHILSGYCSAWDDVNEINTGYFTLDNITYCATEDPDDGYRSMLDEIYTTEYLPNSYIHIPPHIVRCQMSPDEDDKILEIIDAHTNEAIIRVGTSEYTDYYPCWRFDINPEALFQNKINEGDDINEKWKLLEDTNPIFS